MLVWLMLPVERTLAWGPAGHMAVAIIAYQDMPPAMQQRCVAILQAHPNIEKWKEKSASDSPADAAMFTFAKASTWPDEIRRGNSPYDHPAWHYIDYPLTPPDFPFVAGLDPGDNILIGIDQSEKTLRDKAATPEQQAAALSWIIHLVGDIHQPLHAAELVTPAYPLPEGDRGGNKYFVSVGGNAINLHAFWDRLPGQFFSPPFAADAAGRIEKQFPRASLAELTSGKDPVAWSLESRTLAIDKAYLRGKLPGSADSKVLPPPLPPDYLRESKEIADRRLALAGYRLATLLEQVLGSNGNLAAGQSAPGTPMVPAVSKPITTPNPATIPTLMAPDPTKP